jgi:hypothetical protein
VTLTAAPDWVEVAFHICETVCAPGHEKLAFQPAVAAWPEFVTVKPSWKPPLHELTTDQLTWQLPAGDDVLVAVGVGVGVGVTVGVTVGVMVGVGVGVGVAVVAVGVGVGVGVDVGGGVPLPFVKTTTDSAGTDTELPEKVLETMAGLALS